ncbi:acetylornithine/succinyldiaminopimelate/putrescine aminotransferase [Saccharothrix coeruleofusca]|uniref:aspartate aminotransferase family protein n=1 Tax=Saccharothrix coeruleofusca TaxID=33919 RepID=UPI001AE4B185|nr:aminotransferase class III-fold pyridoxal phosphate-dependent enzyme [Saccharothrix coeruleofusca]MBP2337567.1 acetylornithine/succinyldiaminopimelate/putrescine aminotransferase [Saccharothrix coeruleofusca]
MALELAEAHLRGLLAQVGLDAEYVRGEGDTLWWRTPSGDVPVVDFVGGYGSLVLGHNHPALVERARELLDQRVPVHAQFSYHPYANDLAAALNRVLWREFGTDEPYSAIFANTGAEAVEVALKHAEMDRVGKLARLRAEIDEHLASADPELAARARAHNEGRFDLPPVFLTLEGSFHGKLAGSVQLTHNAGYRLPFRGLAAQARFVPPAEVAKAVEAERVTVLDVVDGELVERDLPVVAAFFVEPVQGEGGIRVLEADVAAEIRAAADAAGFPVVVDEVQSGVGRTGAFYAASHVGLLGDYIVLAKAIGGGLAKSSVLLVRRSRYLPEFELLHSSTFAKDAFSCHIGAKVVELLEADGGAAYRRAAERGEALAAALRAVRDEFPTVVADVRGRGLMLGLEFHDRTGGEGGVAEYARMGLLGYVLAGYLLREHHVRVFPTASATHTLRFEPSIEISDEHIDQLVTGLRAVCAALRDQDDSALLPG